MASFCFLLLVIIMTFMALPFLSSASSSSQLISDTPTISTSPVSTSDPPLSPFQELSPDIAPLLPSSGGVVPTTTTGSSMPTIPSSPSPPNPDLMAAGPGSAFPPFGSFPASSSTSTKISFGSLNLSAFSVMVTFCLMQLVRVL